MYNCIMYKSCCLYLQHSWPNIHPTYLHLSLKGLRLSQVNLIQLFSQLSSPCHRDDAVELVKITCGTANVCVNCQCERSVMNILE